MRRSWKATLVAVFAASLPLAAPAAAPAAVTCDYSSQGQLLTVALSEPGDNAQLAVAAGVITVGDSLTPVVCTGPGGPPTTTNTGTVSVTGDAVGQVVVVHGADEFVPGPPGQIGSDAGGATTEIEFFVNLNDAPGSALIVDPGAQAGSMAIGGAGINPNIAGEVGVADTDITPIGVEGIFWFGSEGNDELFGQGGFGTGAPPSYPLTLNGRGGADFIQGGEGPDGLRGGAGADLLFGLGGDDVISPDAGDDIAGGGAGVDTAVVAPTGPAALDLAIVGPQSTGEGLDLFGAFENAEGAGDEATLRGDSGPNRLTGGLAADILEGRGGIDVLESQEGDDTLHVRDGGPDTADCGPDADTVVADPPGIDTLVGCESVLFPAEAPPPGPPSPGPPPPPPGAGPPAIRSLRLAPAAFAALPRGPSARNPGRGRPRAGSIVTFAIDLPATVTYRVARSLPGRRVGRRCVAPTRRNRGRRRCTRLRPVRGSFRRAAQAGTNRFLFTGRIGGRRLARGSYRLSATPHAGGQTGPAASAAFRIRRPPRAARPSA